MSMGLSTDFLSCAAWRCRVTQHEANYGSYPAAQFFSATVQSVGPGCLIEIWHIGVSRVAPCQCQLPAAIVITSPGTTTWRSVSVRAEQQCSAKQAQWPKLLAKEQPRQRRRGQRLDQRDGTGDWRADYEHMALYGVVKQAPLMDPEGCGASYYIDASAMWVNRP